MSKKDWHIILFGFKFYRESQLFFGIELMLLLVKRPLAEHKSRED